MTEDNTPGKKSWSWRLLKRRRSDCHLSDEFDSSGRRTANECELSFLPPSQTGPGPDRPRLVRDLLRKVKKPFPRSAGQSPGPAPITSNTAEVQQLDYEMLTRKRIDDVKQSWADINHLSGTQKIASAKDNLQSVPEAIDTASAALKPLKVFNSIANGLANSHPYAKVALSIFTCASKMILDQADRDDAVSALLTKVSEVYDFITEGGTLAEIRSMQATYVKISQQTLVCADFIAHYSETKNAWERLAKNVLGETDAMIQSYNNALDTLMQQFRDQAALDTVVIVHHMAESLDLIGIEHAAGAGLNPSKCCLPGTRQDLLAEIEDWISSTEEGMSRVLWLSGAAGRGKSAVVHTIANRYIERGGLASCFCFDRTRKADRLQDKIFTTIASDLADCNLIVRRALAKAVHDDNRLKRTADLSKQFRGLILGPTKNKLLEAISTPVLIVIDALDESGEEDSREQILHLLASQLNELSANVRVIVTSRPLEDIQKFLAASHIRRLSMDDISLESAGRDIQRYVSTKLVDLRDTFNDADFQRLTQKSDGLFEWARLACEYIKGTNRVRVDPMSRFKAVVAKTAVHGTALKGTRLLDDMYGHMLKEIIREDEYEEVIPVFRSVMGQIIVSLEPLPKVALTAMRLHFAIDDSHYKIDDVIGSMGSLITGTADSQIPIRPLHASFYDFLTDESRSNKFFVDLSSIQREVTFASLRVMEHGLRFNICSLESSYLPNSAVSDLEKRVKESISPELSYSCRFWGMHLKATAFESSLAEEVQRFFDEERLLFWLEALALMKVLGGSTGTLSSVAEWLTGHAEYTDIGDAVKDTRRFIRTFAPTIIHSTPHLYLSALPFAPTHSRIGRFAEKFPRIPQVVAGHAKQWPLVEKILRTNATPYAITISQDGRRIVCGSQAGMIVVWDMETGEALGAPLRGHTDCVRSVAISPGGTRIVSGSDDMTIRVWDADTGQPLGAPLRGHTDCVRSVAISPGGTRIVSGSNDMTIRVWDTDTGQPLGAPLQGHTNWVNSVAISPDGTRIVSGSYDKTIWVWDADTGKPLGAPLRGHADCVCSVAISLDGTRIVSGSHDDTIQVWDADTGQPLGASLRGHTGGIPSVAISLDGTRIVSGSYDKTIRVWDADTGKLLGAPLQGHTDCVSSVAFSPDGTRIVSGSSDNTIQVWDADTPKSLDAPLQGHTNSVRSIAISPDGTRIVSGSDDKTVRVWDADTGKPFGAPLQGHTDCVYSVAISLDGTRIFSGSHDRIIQVWDADTGKPLGAPRQGHTGFVSCIAISPDGTRIVSGSGDGTIRVWDEDTGKLLGASVQGRNSRLHSVAILLDGNHIVSGLDDEPIWVRDADTGEPCGTPLEGHDGWVRSVAISPDGNCIFSGSDDKTIRVWDADGKPMGAPLRGHTGTVFSIAISPDGTRIVSGSDDTTIRVWDADTGKLLGAPLQGHTSCVYSVAISPDGTRIVSGSGDKTIRVWDADTGKPLGTPLRGHTNSVHSVAISPNGTCIVSGSHDMTIRVWNLELLNDQLLHVPTVCLSSRTTHALSSPSSFLHTSNSPVQTKEGWIVGSEGRLLLWIPITLYPARYAAGNTLVIPNDALQLDLSCFAHGTSWRECQHREAASCSYIL